MPPKTFFFLLVGAREEAKGGEQRRAVSSGQSSARGLPWCGERKGACARAAHARERKPHTYKRGSRAILCKASDIGLWVLNSEWGQRVLLRRLKVMPHRVERVHLKVRRAVVLLLHCHCSLEQVTATSLICAGLPLLYVLGFLSYMCGASSLICVGLPLLYVWGFLSLTCAARAHAPFLS